jgi:hypothetical protein
MKSTQTRVSELLIFGAIELLGLLLLVTRPGKLAMLLLAVVLPLAAWTYARLRTPEHVHAVVGGACGLAAFPVSRGLFSLIVLPFPVQLVGLLGVVGEAVHGFPGNLLATIFDLERRADTSVDSILVNYLFNGLFWAALYGLLGHQFDRLKRSPPTLSP